MKEIQHMMEQLLECLDEQLMLVYKEMRVVDSTQVKSNLHPPSRNNTRLEPVSNPTVLQETCTVLADLDPNANDASINPILLTSTALKRPANVHFSPRGVAHN